MSKEIYIDGVDVSGCLFFTQYGFCTAQLEILGGSGKCSVNNQNCDYKQLNRLKAENEQLKNNDVFSIRYFKDKYDVLKQTLAEIKEIAENAIKNVSDRCIETTPMYGVHKQILQKISECEGNDE